MGRVLRTRRAVAVGTGLLLALAVGGWSGIVVGLAAAVAVDRWLARQPDRASREVERRVAAELPFAVDLLAAALRAGASPDVAARCVGRAIGGPLGERLRRVDHALRMGAGADEAWSYLGGAAAAGRAVARAAARSQHSGAAFASSLYRLADDLRADRLIVADATARRAGVLIVLPLGLCFLPAFVLTGLVPVIVAVLGDVMSP
jgi:pilus assembly protein TadC